MLQYDADLLAALQDTDVRSFTTGIARYQDQSRPLQLTFDGDLSWQSTGEVQASGSVRAFGFGDSLVSRSMTGMLAPFGQEIELSRVVVLRGDRTETIPLGVYRITRNDGGRESVKRTLLRQGNEDDPNVLELSPDGLIYPSALLTVEGDFLNADAFPVDANGFYVGADLVRTQFSAPVVLDWEMGVDLADRFRAVQRNKLVNPKAPVPGASVYQELQRLWPFPLVQVLPDKPVPAGLVYDDRAGAIRDLCAALGGVPRLSRQGALLVRPADRWLSETAPDFDIRGTISWKDEQSDDFYNVVWAHSDDGKFSALVEFDDITHPLSVQRAGASTYEHSSPTYTSDSAAYKGAQTALQRLLFRRSRTVTVEVGAVGLLLELSDFGWFRDPVAGRDVLGEVSDIRISNDPTAPVTVSVIVAEEA